MNFRLASIARGEGSEGRSHFRGSRQTVEKPEKTSGYKLIEASKMAAICTPMWSPARRSRAATGRFSELAKKVGVDKKPWDRSGNLRRMPVPDPFEGSGRGDEGKGGEGGRVGVAEPARADAGNSPRRCLSPSAARRRHSRAPGSFGCMGAATPSSICSTRRTRGIGFRVETEKGGRAFGCVPETRPILQKGDSVLPPPPHKSKAHDRQRYLAEYFNAKPAGPGVSQPKVQWVREIVN